MVIEFRVDYYSDVTLLDRKIEKVLKKHSVFILFVTSNTGVWQWMFFPGAIMSNNTTEEFSLTQLRFPVRKAPLEYHESQV